MWKCLATGASEAYLRRTIPAPGWQNDSGADLREAADLPLFSLLEKNDSGPAWCPFAPRIFVYLELFGWIPNFVT